MSFQPTENHRLTLAADLYDNTSKGHDFSYNLNSSNLIKGCSDGHCAEKALRHTNDQVKRNNYSVIYENYSVNPLYDTLRISFSNQKFVLEQEPMIIVMEIVVVKALIIH